MEAINLREVYIYYIKNVREYNIIKYTELYDNIKEKCLKCG